MLRSIGKQSGESVESVLKKKRKDLRKRKARLTSQWSPENAFNETYKVNKEVAGFVKAEKPSGNKMPNGIKKPAGGLQHTASHPRH